MASTAVQNIDTWIRAPYTDADYLSTGVQQHPGNGVSLSTADGDEAIRFSVAKTSHGYTVNGLNDPARCGSRVYSMTPNMRQAYAAAGITGARSLDRPRLASTAGACA